MKNRIIFIALLLIFIVIIVLISIFFIRNNEKNILLSNDNQVDVLIEIYNDFISSMNINDNIILSDNTLKNIITGERFDEENIERLRKFEDKKDNSNNPYTLSIEFFPKTNILNVTISRNKYGYESKSQKYKLSIKNGKINYEQFGEGTIVAS